MFVDDEIMNFHNNNNKPRVTLELETVQKLIKKR